MNERGEDPSQPQELSRRKFLKLGAASAVALGGLYLTGRFPRIDFLDRPPLEEYDSDIEEIRKQFPNARWIDHNAGNNPYIRKMALEGPAVNIEADAIDFDNQPFIYHSRSEFERDIKIHPDYLESQKASNVFKEIIESGKNPAIDIKSQSQDGFDRLMEAVYENIPEDVVVSFSGEPRLVEQTTERKNSIIIPTYQPWEVNKYKSNAENTWRDFDPEYLRFGASFGPNFSDRQVRELLNYNKEHELDLESNMWIIDDPRRMLTLLRWGATSITTNRRNIIGRATNPF